MFLIQTDVSCTWTNDSQRVLLEHFDLIHNSPSHIYHSALPFSPSSSWLHKCYIAELSQEVSVVEGLQAEWGVYSHTIHLNDAPLSISYWNNTIAVGSEHRDILILNTVTGSYIVALLGHTDTVGSLTFSSDGVSLVSGSYDNTVKLWDVQTGGVVKTFCGHTGRVNSVSISADSITIASGSYDKTIRLWNIQTGACHQIMEQKDEVYDIKFSPKDPKILISLCDKIVQRWDIDGHRVGPEYLGFEIAFSPDGTQFISYRGGGFTVQNIHSGAIVANFDVASVSAFAVMKKTPFKNFINQQNTTQSQHFDDQLELHTPFTFLSPPLLRHTMHKDKTMKTSYWFTRVNCPPHPIHEYSSHHQGSPRSHGHLPGPRQEHSRPFPQPRSRLPKLQLHPMPRPSP